MKEKEKCTMKAEDSSYGPVADSRCPFSEDAEIHRLQNAFGEALGDMPLPEETRKEWSIFVQRQEQKKTETPSPHLVVRRRSSNARFIHIALVALAENG